LPVFLWLGPVWLVFYWFIVFFGYAKIVERIVIVFLTLLLAGAPLLLDLTSHWMAGIDSPVVMSAIASEERSYQPDALRRMQELVNIVPDDAMLRLLLGNLYLQDGNEQQAGLHYQRSAELHDSAGAHVNLGNLHFFNNDFATAVTEYNKAEILDPRLAIAFYDESIALGELYKYDQQAQKLDQARRSIVPISSVCRLSTVPETRSRPFPPHYFAGLDGSSAIARRGVARSLFGNYAWFDPKESVRNPVTAGALLTLILTPVVFFKRRRVGFAGSCMKCGRTYCHRCKSARESATFCTQCIHIYLKRDGVSMGTKRAKFDEVNEHQGGMPQAQPMAGNVSYPVPPSSSKAARLPARLRRLLSSFCIACAPFRTPCSGVGPGRNGKVSVRIVAIAFAILLWFLITLPVYRRRVSAS